MTTHPFIYENDHLTSLVVAMHQHMRTYGYRNVQVPAIADVDLFLTKAGDQIIESLFTFERFGRQLALRPEFTALAAHRYATAYPQGGTVARWQFNGSVFRENYAQRKYQQMSIGAELIGLASPLADAEMLTMSVRGLREVAGLQDVRLALGHVGLLRHALKRFGLDERTEHFLLEQMGTQPDLAAAKDDVLSRFDSYFTFEEGEAATPPTDLKGGTQQMLDVMLDATQMGETMGGRSRGDIVARMIRKSYRAGQRGDVSAALDFLAAWASAPNLDALRGLGHTNDATYTALLDQLASLLELLAAADIPDEIIELRPALIRDWTYYTGVVFGFQNTNGDVFGGGGRYDELVQLLGAAHPVPAIGFAYYVDDILAAYNGHTKSQQNTPLTLGYSAGGERGAFQLAEQIRAAGWPVLLDTDPAPPDITLTVEQAIIYRGDTFQLDDVTSLLQSLEATYRDR